MSDLVRCSRRLLRFHESGAVKTPLVIQLLKYSLLQYLLFDKWELVVV